MTKYTYGKQWIDQKDLEAVQDVLNSDWLTQGPQVTEFENNLSQILSGIHFVKATAVSSGTAALHVLAKAMGWKEGDVIITTPLSFVATSNCILYVGAEVEFVDILPNTGGIDPQLVANKVQELLNANRNVVAIIAVEYAGIPCEWDALLQIAQKYNLKLISDSCHSLGAKLNHSASYISEYCDAQILSFHPLKHITTGEGGAIVTKNTELHQKCQLFRSHGITKNPSTLIRNDQGPWYYEMHELGFNYRITDLQCALGNSQLQKLDFFIEQRQKGAAFYQNAFKDSEYIQFLKGTDGSAWHLFPIFVPAKHRKALYIYLSENNIFCQVHYFPIHLQPYYQQKMNSQWGDFPKCEEFYNSTISIPLHPGLNIPDYEYISGKVKNFFLNIS